MYHQQQLPSSFQTQNHQLLSQQQQQQQQLFDINQTISATTSASSQDFNSNNNTSNNNNMLINNLSNPTLDSNIMEATLQQLRQQQIQNLLNNANNNNNNNSNNNNNNNNNNLNKMVLMYGNEPLPFNDEKNLLLLSALNNDGLNSIYNIQLQQQLQQQQQQLQNPQQLSLLQQQLLLQQQQQQQQLHQQPQQPQHQQQQQSNNNNSFHSDLIAQHLQQNLNNNNNLNSPINSLLNNNHITQQQHQQAKSIVNLVHPIQNKNNGMYNNQSQQPQLPQFPLQPQKPQTNNNITNNITNNNKTTNSNNNNKPSTTTTSNNNNNNNSQHVQRPTDFAQLINTLQSKNSSLLNPSFFLNNDDDFEETNLTEKQKSRRRASQNLASRNYRQRKKAYVNEMEARLESIVSENEKLKRDLLASRKTINRLLKENSILKSGGQIPAKSDIPGCTGDEDEEEEVFEEVFNTAPNEDEGEVDLSVLIERLEVGMKIESNNDLTGTLKMFYDALKDRQNLYINQIKQIINPCTQAKLALLDGEITCPVNENNTSCPIVINDDANPKTPTDANNNGHQNNYDSPIVDIASSPLVLEVKPSLWWQSFITEGNINEEQEIRIRQLRIESSTKYQRLIKVRQILNKEIREFYHSKIFNPSKSHRDRDRESTPLSTPVGSIVSDSSPFVKMEEDNPTSAVHSSIAELSELLDSVKENLDHENALILQTYEQLGLILSPFQEALLITRVFNNSSLNSGSSNVQLLHAIWDVISITSDQHQLYQQQQLLKQQEKNINIPSSSTMITSPTTTDSVPTPIQS
eukprot:gene11339-13883_t